MPLFPAPHTRQATAACILLLSAATAGWLLYGQARGLGWQFDDLLNLQLLAKASTRTGLLDFVFGGVAGPLGRPLALLTFLADYDDWPANPWGFVRHTLILHLMNGGLVFVLFRPILARLPTWSKQANLAAALIAALWLIMPIHASGILMPIQRMSELSGFFVLATLAAWVHLRLHYETRPNFAAAVFLAIVALSGATLATYAKENGALVLSLIPVLEWTLLSGVAAPTWPVLWRWGLRLAFLIVPALLVAHLVTQWQGIQANYQFNRDFSLADRLATESIILWEYLRQIVLPRAAAFGPFHDGHVVHTWRELSSWIASGAWLTVLAGTWLWSRRDAALGRAAFFALAFFLVAHLIESSFIPLELYFEHRNYVAALGIAVFFALAAVRAAQSGRWRRPVLLLALAFVGLQLFTLQQVSSLWGKPLLAAEMWYRTQPDSTRAVQTLAWLHGQIGDDARALELLDEFSNASPIRLDTRIQALVLACTEESPTKLQKRLDELETGIPALRRPAGITTGITNLTRKVLDGDCPGISVQTYRPFIEALLASPQVRNNARIRHHIHHQMAAIAAHEDRKIERIHYLKLAFLDFPSLSGAEVVAAQLLGTGHPEEAMAWIDQAVDKAPTGAAGGAWRSSLMSLRDAIVHIEDLRREAGLVPIREEDSPGDLAPRAEATPPGPAPLE